MKNLSLILNIVLLVAVAVLFYLHFSGKQPSKSGTTSAVFSGGDIKVAYINSDSVLKHYDYWTVSQKALETKVEKLQAELDNRRTSLEADINVYQRTVNNMTYNQQQASQADLNKKQQNLQMYQQSLSQQMSMEEAKVQKELYEKITAYCKKYGTENGIQVVLKYDLTSDVLYAVDALDISNEIVKGLNEEFKTGGTKSDTTKVSK